MPGFIQINLIMFASYAAKIETTRPIKMKKPNWSYRFWSYQFGLGLYQLIVLSNFFFKFALIFTSLIEPQFYHKYE